MVIYVNGQEAAKKTVGPIVQDPKLVGQWIQLSASNVNAIADELFVARTFDPALIVREMKRAR